MAQLFSSKLIIVISFLLFANKISGQQWNGVTTQTASTSKTIITGSTSDLLNVKVEIPGFYLKEVLNEGKKFQKALLPDGHPILAKGNPDLQKLCFTFELPSNGDMEVNILSSKYVEYNNIEILPFNDEQTRNGSGYTFLKGEQYSTNAFYPTELIEYQKPFIVRNTRSQAYQVYPLQYNPITKILRFYYQLEFNIKNKGNAGENALESNDYRIKSIEGIESGSIKSKTSLLKSRQLPSERGKLLIICPENFVAAIIPLAEWRKQTGIATEIVYAEKFKTAEDIKSFVKEYYYANGNLAYLLLVGDAKQVPPYNYAYGSSDNYYSYLAGDDHYPEILVGRISAESIKDVEVQVTRTLQYEKNPGADANWIANATGLGSTLSPGDDGEADFEHIRNLLKTLKTTTYTKVNELLDGTQGGNDAEGNPTPEEVTRIVNQGTGIIFYAGHGSPLQMTTGSIKKSLVDGLNNTGKYPLIWSAACENGNFENKLCIAESWMRATNSKGQPTGALAALMAAGSQTSYPPMEAQDKIAELLSDPKEGLATMGAISVKGMMSMNDVYGNAGFATTDTWILFGDPSLRVRTSVPKTFIVQHKSYIGAGQNIFTVECNTTSGFACLSNEGEILGTAVLVEGKAIIYMDKPVYGENITLTITAINYLPYIKTIPVIKNTIASEKYSPQNHSRLQPINSTFSWDSGDGGKADYYLFYLGTDNPPSNIINGAKLTATQIKAQNNLDYNQLYYWKVVPVNGFGMAESKVLQFETVFAPDDDFETTFKSSQAWCEDNLLKGWVHDESQFFDGKQSIRSGQISDNEFSSLKYDYDVTNCDFVSFWSKTSSEQGDKLKFLIDSLVVGEWSGISDWNFHSYKVDAGKHRIEWRYEKNGSLEAGEDAAWIDNIHLPIHSAATATSQGEGSVCKGSVFEAYSKVQNYSSITWRTDGDGTFTDNTLENVTYKPGILDTFNEKTTLHMQVKGYDGCPEITTDLFLDINALPVINLPSDTIITDGSFIELDATTSGVISYNWEPGGSMSPVFVIDSTGTEHGSKTASVTLMSPQGCTSTKNILVHFNNPDVTDIYTIYPNPNNGNFTLQPMKGSAVIDQMRLIDMEGKVVWSSEEKSNIVGAKQMSIPGLKNGTYYLVTTNLNGRTINPIVIQY